MVKDNIKVFAFHGFTSNKESGDHHIGNCPFCNYQGSKGRNYFYVNHETQKWDCKVCHKSGGVQSFLQQIAEHCTEMFKGRYARRLAKERGLDVETLRSYEVGYNIITENYTIPIWDINHTRIIDIGIFDGKTIMSTPGCKTGLLGWGNTLNSFNRIWLCEGAWDGMAMSEILGNKKGDDIILSVPGAGTLKQEWLPLFQDKEVNILFDNDKAGKDATGRAYQKLATVNASGASIEWPSTYKAGYDIRDLKRDNGLTKARILIKRFLKEAPEFLKGIVSQVKVSEPEYTGEGLSARKVRTGFKEWMKFPYEDTTVLDILYGAIIANRMPGDPLWLFLVAPSGGMKTELLLSLGGSPGIYETTSLTAHTLLSGTNFGAGGDPSLIPKLNKKVLIIKDFTTILNMNPMARDEIFGLLRDAYDGSIIKHFGNAIIRSYKSKFGIVAGVTPAIELYTEEHTALGERFLRYKINTPTGSDFQKDILMKAVSNIGQEDNMRSSLAGVSKELLNCEYNNIPEVPISILNRIIALAQWTALLRATITRDKYTKEVTHKPFSEIGTRLVKQYTKLLMGICMFRRKEEVGISEYSILKNVALSTIPSRLEIIVSFLNRADRPHTADEISEAIKLPKITCTRLVENLVMLKVLKRIKIGAGMRTEWQMTQSMRKLIADAELYKRSRRKQNE